MNFKISSSKMLKPLMRSSFGQCTITRSSYEHSMSIGGDFLQIQCEKQCFPQMALLYIIFCYVIIMITMVYMFNVV